MSQLLQMEAVPFDLNTGTTEFYDNPEIYDHEFRRYVKDKRFYLNMGKSINGPVLEFGCGSGRLLYNWVKAGIEVQGIDLNSHMLEKADKKLRHLGRKKTSLWKLKEGDMRFTGVEKKYPLIVSAFNSMMHLYEYSDMDTFLENVKSHMEKDSTFIFDILNPDFRWLLRDPARHWARTRFKHPWYNCWYYYTTNHYYDAATQISYVYIYHQSVTEGEGPSYMLRFAHRFYYPQEIQYILKRHGFRLDGYFGNFDGSDLEIDSPSQIYICGI
ncbi:MAG: methyltransferase [Deltaproteobacteria bacterium]|nr:methyltransferase [Deltaproteobacteria bacterium]